MAALVLSARARKDLLRLAEPYASAVEAGIERLISEPSSGKPLHGDYEGLRSLRIGVYRVVYAFNARTATVEVVWVRHRREAYR